MSSSSSGPSPTHVSADEVKRAVENVRALVVRMIDGDPVPLDAAAAQLKAGVRGRSTHIVMSQNELHILHAGIALLKHTLEQR